jgi:hypothetical protein
MRNVVIVLFLSMAVVANAGLMLKVKYFDNGIYALWNDYADSKYTITAGTTIELGVFNITNPTPVEKTLALGIVSGPADLSAGIIKGFKGATAMMLTDVTAAESHGFAKSTFVSMVVPEGFGIGTTSSGQMVARGIFFTCGGEGDVEIALVDGNGEVVDSQVVHQIPEPMTLALLGIGGLAMSMIRKRSA